MDFVGGRKKHVDVIKIPLQSVKLSVRANYIITRRAWERVAGGGRTCIECNYMKLIIILLPLKAITESLVAITSIAQLSTVESRGGAITTTMVLEDEGKLY